MLRSCRLEGKEDTFTEEPSVMFLYEGKQKQFKPQQL